MNRLLRPVRYQLIVGNKEFTQIKHVYAYPRKGAIVTVHAIEFLILEERQNLDVYAEQGYKNGEPAESVVAVPYLIHADYIKIQETLRAHKEWVETESLTIVHVESANDKKGIFDAVAVIFMIATLVGFFYTGVWVWLIGTLQATIWVLQIYLKRGLFRKK